MAKIGAPSKYSTEIADKICEIISTSSRGIQSIANELGISPAIIFKWLADEDKKDFLDKYARAKEFQAELMVEDILTIADETGNDTITKTGINGESYDVPNNEWINRSKLRVDARKWIASKLLPKKYGDKLDITTKGNEMKQIFKIGGQEIEM